MGPYYGKVEAFVLVLDIVSPHGPPFSKIVESTSDGIDGPWIVTHIGQGGMADDWWQSGSLAIFPIYTVYQCDLKEN